MEVFLEALRGFQEPGLLSADEHADSSPCWKEIKKERNKQRGGWEEKKTFRKGGEMTPSQPHSLRVPLMAGLELGLRVQRALSHPCAHPGLWQ